MTQKPQSAEIYSRNLSRRISLTSLAARGTKSEKRLAIQKLTETGLLTKAHSGSAIGLFKMPQSTALAALFELLGLLSTVTGLGLIWYSGVI